MRLLEFVIILALLLVCAATVRDDLGVRRDLGASEATARDLRDGRSADVAAASQRQADCTKAFDGALSAGLEIAKVSAVRPRTDPKMQPMVSAAQIEAVLQ